MKVLVTGGSGRIGADLMRLLGQKRFEVTVFDLVEPRASELSLLSTSIRVARFPYCQRFPRLIRSQQRE